MNETKQKTQTYTKINTLYRRYKNLGKVELPSKAWVAFQNKIILDGFSDEEIRYLQNNLFDCFSKIDGTNTKIVFYPSTGEIAYGGKTDDAQLNMHDKIMPGICERIKPLLAEMFPPECARFTPKQNEKRQTVYYHLPFAENPGEMFEDIHPNEMQTGDQRVVVMEEAPVYIYGELFGAKIQKGGGNYSDGIRFSVFDVCQQGWWIPVGMLAETCQKLGLDMVPYIGKMTIKEAEKMVMNGFATKVENVVNPEYLEEGIVARPVVPLKDSHGNRIIVKIKHKDYSELRSAIQKVGEIEYNKFVAWYNEHKEEIENL